MCVNKNHLKKKERRDKKVYRMATRKYGGGTTYKFF